MRISEENTSPVSNTAAEEMLYFERHPNYTWWIFYTLHSGCTMSQSHWQNTTDADSPQPCQYYTHILASLM